MGSNGVYVDAGKLTVTTKGLSNPPTCLPAGASPVTARGVQGELQSTVKGEPRMCTAVLALSPTSTHVTWMR